MKLKGIGIGAAGNKAFVSCVENGVISKECTLLVNSNSGDIPQAYIDRSVVIGNDINGSGKEPSLGAAMMDAALGDDGEVTAELVNFLQEDDEAVVLAAATEGGTGAGGLPVLANFIIKEVGIHVHCFIFTGFHEDVKGLANTIDVLKKLPQDKCTIHIISNLRCLGKLRNKTKAEEAANAEFSTELDFLIGNNIVEGTQNIDQTDMYKLTNVPKYSYITKVSLAGLKTLDDVEEALHNAILYTKSLPIDSIGCKRIGCVWNITHSMENIIDTTVPSVKELVGEPDEVFKHLQYIEDEDQAYVYVVVTGMKLPVKELGKLYEEFLARKVNEEKDDSEEKLQAMDVSALGNEFAVNFANKKKSSFFGKKVAQQEDQKPAKRSVISVPSSSTSSEGEENY